MMRHALWVGLVVIGSLVGIEARGEISAVTCEEAKRLIESSEPAKRPVVIDTRGGYKDYFRSHLPTAHHLNFDTLRGTDRGVPVQYLPDDLTAALLVRAGVDRDRTHLLYATGDKLPSDEILSTSMVAYVLEKFGVRDIRVIDGGLAEWQRLGYPTTQEYFGNPPGKLPSQKDVSIGIGIEELLTKLGRLGVVLVDARPRNEYLGEDDVWLRKGHIPGAISFHWARLMEPGNTHKFRSLEEASRELASVGLDKGQLDKGQEVIVYCGTSREGSLLRFYLRHVAGFPNVRLYEGSWKEYAALKQHPAETKENRLK